MLRGKLVRCAPTTAMSIVATVVWSLLAMVERVYGCAGGREGGMNGVFLDSIVVCSGFNAVYIVGVLKDLERMVAFWKPEMSM